MPCARCRLVAFARRLVGVGIIRRHDADFTMSSQALLQPTEIGDQRDMIADGGARAEMPLIVTPGMPAAIAIANTQDAALRRSTRRSRRRRADWLANLGIATRPPAMIYQV